MCVCVLVLLGTTTLVPLTVSEFLGSEAILARPRDFKGLFEG